MQLNPESIIKLNKIMKKIRLPNAIINNNLIGKKFNKWTVIKEIKKENQSSRHFECRCDCGNIKVLSVQSFKIGKSKQCYSCSFYKHGLSKTRTYKIWAGIINRCTSPKSTIYKWYGGKGIRVCERWLKFENFLTDMGICPDNLEIDRIDSNKDYELSNCRWVTRQENIKNIKLLDSMPGKKFGKWIVLKKVNTEKKDHWYYECRCECGTIAIKPGGELRRGKTKQCRKCAWISHRNWPQRKKDIINAVKS